MVGVKKVSFSEVDALAYYVLDLYVPFFLGILICCFLVGGLSDFVLKFKHRFKLVFLGLRESILFLLPIG